MNATNANIEVMCLEIHIAAANIQVTIQDSLEYSMNTIWKTEES